MTILRVFSFPAALALLFTLITSPAFGGDLKLAETDDTVRIELRGKPVLECVKGLHKGRKVN